VSGLALGFAGVGAPNKKRGGWYTVVSFGRNSIPFGPWRSRDEGEKAVGRWRERLGWTAGSEWNASSASIVGPFPSRQIARDADISDYYRYLIK